MHVPERRSGPVPDERGSARWRAGALLALSLAGITGGLWASAMGLFTVEDLRHIVQEAGPWGPALYLGAAVVLSLFWVPRLVVSMVAGAAFGVVQGGILAVVGGVAGALAAYGAARLLGADYVQSHMRSRGRLTALVEQHGFAAVLLGRMCPGMPCELISIAAGLVAMPASRYITATVIAMVPSGILYAALGASALEADPRSALGVGAANVALALAALVAFRRVTARKAEAG